jgi:hypothetical protein
MVVSAEFSLLSQNSVTFKALVDSGALARGFINHSLVQNLRIPTYKTPYTRTLMLADDRAAAEKITDYVILPMRISNYYENTLFFVTKFSQETLVILGLQWLYKHNPSIDFRNNFLTFISPYCHRFCLILGQSNRAPMIKTPAKDFHDLPVSGESSLTPGEASAIPFYYKQPYAKEMPENSY